MPLSCGVSLLTTRSGLASEDTMQARVANGRTVRKPRFAYGTGHTIAPGVDVGRAMRGARRHGTLIRHAGAYNACPHAKVKTHCERTVAASNTGLTISHKSRNHNSCNLRVFCMSLWLHKAFLIIFCIKLNCLPMLYHSRLISDWLLHVHNCQKYVRGEP